MAQDTTASASPFFCALQQKEQKYLKKYLLLHIFFIKFQPCFFSFFGQTYLYTPKPKRGITIPSFSVTVEAILSAILNMLYLIGITWDSFVLALFCNEVKNGVICCGNAGARDWLFLNEFLHNKIWMHYQQDCQYSLQ